MKQFIKFLSIMVIAFLFLTTSTAFAEKVTFVKEYNYNASDLDSKVSSRAIALEQVKRLLLEELGTYLISETEVKNFRLTKDQVTAYSAGVVSAEVIDEKWDGKTYYLKAKVSADPAEVIKSLQNIVADKQKSKDLEDVRKKAADYSKEIERLKKELEIAKADTKKPAHKADEKKIEQYNETVKGLSATDWFEKGLSYSKSGKHKEAINANNKAIELNPQYAEAWNNRGNIYYELGKYKQAINDYNKALGIDSKFAGAYFNLGNVYHDLRNYQKAITNLNKAIELNLRFADAYTNRGVAYGSLKNYPQAINDFSRAIDLNQQDVKSYFNRGLIYHRLGNYQQAINDFSKAIELKPQDVEAYFNRGLAYHSAVNYQQALNDYNQVLEINPQHNIAFYNKACLYAIKKEIGEACKWLGVAVEKGFRDWTHIKSDKDLDNIRTSFCYKKIMAGK